MKCTLNVNIYKNTAFPYLLARVLRRSVVKILLAWYIPDWWLLPSNHNRHQGQGKYFGLRMFGIFFLCNYEKHLRFYLILFRFIDSFRLPHSQRSTWMFASSLKIRSRFLGLKRMFPKCFHCVMLVVVSLQLKGTSLFVILHL
jgi:hypothetical protein